MCRNLVTSKIPKANPKKLRRRYRATHYCADWIVSINGKQIARPKSACVLYQFLHVAYLRRNTQNICCTLRRVYYVGVDLLGAVTRSIGAAGKQ